ncbi:magnesium/cobalt transporter CorA [Suttonella ornithocola]|uniref:Magnesium transport protein CorA n=1 Tax=Suttonella ornithocola TaxID=279832 RepID=A0A380MPU1_9GAMM|nr:magnesium/cobalt transporter CorA [Suttonella ornithocola]SUO93913.1 Magnesium transport protein CorA [Suttonella ornithocola]
MAKKISSHAPVTITRTDFSLHEQVETALTLEEFFAVHGKHPHTLDMPLTWFHFSGINDAQTLEKILSPYDIHELVIEDMTNSSQQTKAEIYKGYLFIVARTFHYRNNTLGYDQLFMIVLPNLLLTFEPRHNTHLSPVSEGFDPEDRESADLNSGFLAYALLDCVVERYYGAIDALLSKIEKNDRKLFSSNSNLTLNKVHKLKQDSIRILSTVRRMNDTLTQLMRWNNPFINQHTKTYLRDLVDTTLQMRDRMDYGREMIQSLTDTYLNLQSNQLNLQMRLLTVITIIFMPLTLLTGIYGMNFDNMPELHTKYGYFILLGVMGLIVGFLLFIFRRKNWL